MLNKTHSSKSLSSPQLWTQINKMEVYTKMKALGRKSTVSGTFQSKKTADDYADRMRKSGNTKVHVKKLARNRYGVYVYR